MSIVGKNKSISNIEKYHHLRYCLEGAAEKLIRPLAVIGENYPRAWAMLKEHYENEKEVARANFAAFTAVPKMRSDTAEELDRVFNAVTSVVSGQEGIGRPIETHGFDLLNHLVTEMFDPKTRLEWASYTSESTDVPSHDTLVKFITRRALTLKVAKATTAKTSGNPPRSAKSHHAKGSPTSSQCVLCKGKHNVMMCDEFKAKSATERKTVAETHRLCFNCLGPHQIAKCQSAKTCNTCKARHHSMLHDAYTTVKPAEASTLSAVRRLQLADPEFRATDPIELLLGAEVCSIILEEGLRKGGPQAPIAQRTSLGWILSGGCVDPPLLKSRASLQCTAEHELTALVRRFWEQEREASAPVAATPEEQLCEDIFTRSHSRTATGRYIVRLPFASPPPTLSDTRKPAESLLHAVERKCSLDSRFGELYRAFLKEYEDVGHMTRVDDSTNPPSQGPCYLPHHGVLRESSATTKLRVVFNGSQRTKVGESLNSHMLIGANLLPALADVLMRWRWHRFAFITDIEKMYRQILVAPEDRDLQRILWRHSTTDPIREFRLNTVTYGLACAPFLAIRTLQQLATDEESRFPRGSAVLRRDCYVDDIVTGTHEKSDAIAVQTQLRQLCMAGGFELRKWASNCPEILAGIPPSHRLQGEPHSWEQEIHSTLGLRWHSGDDSFAFSIPPSTVTKFSKRTVLAETARLFDPLGWLTPVIIRAKILIQSAWMQRLDWDEPLPSADTLQWESLLEELPRLKGLRVKRWLGTGAENSRVELHGFADASERTYAATIYLRLEHGSEVKVQLLAAKSKVAPIKPVSLPRLELCAAALLTQLTAHVQSILSLSAAPVVLWSDSKVTLHWIRGHASRWKTFVANRVTLIQELLPEARWRHVPGRDNPADCASRGVAPTTLIHHPLWWFGPSWLLGERAGWPTESPDVTQQEIPEMRATALVANAEAVEEPELLLRFSELHRLLRVTAWCLRWRETARKPEGNLPTTLRPEELDSALSRWLRVVQALHFPAEVSTAKDKRAPPRKSTLIKLNPYLDDAGVLRVGGRLRHAALPHDERHPTIAPPRSHLTRLLVESYHRRTLHGGVQITLGMIRLRFWVPQGRSVVKRWLHRCVTCTRWRAATLQPPMGDLPRERVTPARPFTRTGIDYAGPIFVRTTKGRGHRALKAFIAIFVCLSSKAVHIEVVSDYSSDAFLAALRRFTSRRGLCTDIFSDCGTTFVGADRQLGEMLRASSPDGRRIATRAADQEIRWHFNPPSAPHFGGLWEAAVKSTKYHLRRVIGDTTLTFEEMSTLLAQVEACLNSRPLQALSDDPDDISALTPGHLLIGAPLLAVPEPSQLERADNALSRWQHLQKMRDHFWLRWSREYIHTLAARPKWVTQDAAPHIGSLCLVRTETTPPCRWPLARVIKLHPGKDGVTRVATVRSASSELVRPLVKLVLLPGDSLSGSPSGDT
ncbi:PREDICTED: uncharacterized protein LOC105556882 [Vollenhovia emeryi]|uniref:uncharacterized protein LOC105556882 n=1 Tax=Vollenhovia emeryi TaxID=411798 RepID=UPI0005F38C5B|nr:PREDICTED: uncharacterized protein LOC105556882 [Vollenhovia emeryi]